MLDPDSQDTSIEALRSRPSEDLWAIEIERILGGARDNVLEHLGDAGAYIEDLINESSQPPIARVMLYRALDYQVARWGSGRGDTWMIDLIRRFTPDSGYEKLIELFQVPGAFGGDPDPLDETFSGTTLRLRALHALERYFPGIPLAESEPNYYARRPTQENYRTYIRILREHTGYPAYREYARHAILAHGEDIAPPARPHNRSVAEWLVEEDLEVAYEAALRAGRDVAEDFLEQLRTAASVEILETSLFIVGHESSRTVRVRVEGEALAEHFAIYTDYHRPEDAIQRAVALVSQQW